MTRFCILTIVFAAAIAVAVESAPADEGPPLRVDDLVKAKWHRVPGPAYGGAALDTGEPGSWCRCCASAATVDFDGELYRMWFVGSAKTDDPGVPYGYYERIGLATSSDGVKWEMANGGRPVLDLGPPGSPDAKGLAHPFVLRVEKTFMMWYGAIDGKQAKDLGLGPPHVRVERICLATSTDGVRWQRANGGKPVMDIGPPGSIDSIQATGMHVIKKDDTFLMWYGAYGGRHTIGTASSPDGVRWTKTNEGRPVNGLLGKKQLGPSVYFDGGRYFMLYNTGFEQQWATFAARSENGIDWEPVYDGQPVLDPPPAGSFGTAGPGRNHSVHSTKILFHGRTARAWYSAEDGSPPHFQRVGLMEAVLPTN